MMLCLGDVGEHDIADTLRVYLVNEDDNIRHECLARLDDESRYRFVMRYPEGFECQEWIENIISHNATISDAVGDDAGWARGVQYECECGDDDEDASDDIAEDEGDCGDGECDDTDRPVPVGFLLDIEVFGCSPGNERIHARIISSYEGAGQLSNL